MSLTIGNSNIDKVISEKNVLTAASIHNFNDKYLEKKTSSVLC